MILLDKTTSYYVLFLANLLIVFSLIPIVYQTTVLRMTANIPYFSLICLGIAFLIFCSVTFDKNYWIHFLMYTIGLLCVIVLAVNKTQFDKNTIKVVTTIEEPKEIIKS